MTIRLEKNGNEAKKYSNIFTISKQQVKNFKGKDKTGKSPGYDGISFEHIKNAGDELIEIMTHLFTMMLKTQWKPANIKKGLVIPIPKHGKDASVPDNNRGITLLSAVSKIYDTLVLNLMQPWLDNHSHPLQGANRKLGHYVFSLVKMSARIRFRQRITKKTCFILPSARNGLLQISEKIANFGRQTDRQTDRHTDRQTDRQTDRNFIDNKKSQLDLHVMCIHGIQQQKTQAEVNEYIKCT